ncbi:GNAT family acetyltransferase [Azospirillum sp. RWY-5-1]|uniref:GNAT family acetyltransferase n=1 Tax=Azospirillum oleiclasticum TaxID=2735135 RepID=A0ABX2T7W3_9PROT|nr:GNAT family acetyltransferase [Azospirillum oleiclasticum]NYZ12088.1 GNAT family acetyltransferase [Azospirillum oleiclasticum]NYZ19248.1 GNAT family acetyltransferase [Azospirillum oleiclasticum]
MTGIGTAPAIRPMRAAECDAVIALWHACGLVVPWNDPAADIALALSKPCSTVLVAEEEGGIAASVMVGHDGHRGWLYYLAVAPMRQRRGLGRAMVSAAEAWLAEAGPPKVQLMVRATNTMVLAFYETLGYAPSPVTVMQKWLRDPSA